MSNPALKVEKDGDVWAVVLSDPQSPDFFVVLDRFDTQQHAEDYCFGCVEPILNRVIETATDDLDKQLAVETTERERWQSMVDSSAELMNEVLYLKLRLAAQEAALVAADNYRRTACESDGSTATCEHCLSAVLYDEARAATKIWRDS